MYQFEYLPPAILIRALALQRERDDGVTLFAAGPNCDHNAEARYLAHLATVIVRRAVTQGACPVPAHGDRNE